MAEIKLPFSLAKPSDTEFATQASAVGMSSGSSVEDEVTALKSQMGDVSTLLDELNGTTEE